MFRIGVRTAGPVGVALFLVLALAGGFAAQRRLAPPMRPLDAGGLALVVAICLALAFARRRPAWTLAATAVLTAAYAAAFYPYGPVCFATTVAMYQLAIQVPAGRAALACGATFAGLVGASVFAAPGDLGAAAIAWALCLAVPLGVGTTVKLRRAADLAQERLLLAREVHDVVAHGLAAISMQAGAALHVFERQPETARQALAAIRDTSGEALAELRGALNGVRDGAGLAGLPALVERLGRGGMAVRVRSSGAAPPLRRDVDHAAYRIVQESLTNVARHAGAESATVTLAYRPDGVAITVADDGTAVAHLYGHGLAGMRERAASVGGRLEAGPHDDGGFRVHAWLPR
ncbi:sensor histidine kinase [Dactylosporangium darangshiense]|uniref:sensor histidine kinase n=1 Tax=Dactylosporangium darangshiense TaxID=579108 RepID=UPI0031F1275E